MEPEDAQVFTYALEQGGAALRLENPSRWRSYDFIALCFTVAEGLVEIVHHLLQFLVT